MRRPFLFLARALFSLIFIRSSVYALFNWSDTVANFNKALGQWQVYVESFVYMKDILWYCVSQASLLIGVAILLEMIGGILIFIGYKIRVGAFLLLLFFISKTIVFHPFWLEIGEGFSIQAPLFLKHLSIIGALLYFLIGPQVKKDSTDSIV